MEKNSLLHVKLEVNNCKVSVREARINYQHFTSRDYKIFLYNDRSAIFSFANAVHYVFVEIFYYILENIKTLSFKINIVHLCINLYSHFAFLLFSVQLNIVILNGLFQVDAQTNFHLLSFLRPRPPSLIHTLCFSFLSCTIR